MNEDKIFQKLIEHDGKFLEHDEQLGRIEANIVGMKGEIHHLSNTMDKAMVILQRLDHERLFTIEWVKRIEGDVERIKTHLHLT